MKKGKAFPLEALQAYKQDDPAQQPSVTVNFDLAPLIALLTRVITPRDEVKSRGHITPVGA